MDHSLSRGPDRSRTMPSFRIVLLVSLLAPIVAHADVHRCVVDGKTVFQQHPGDAQRAYSPPAGQEPPSPRQATRSPPAASPTAAQPGPPPPPARAAEFDPAGRELDRLRALMCAKTNRKYPRSELGEVLVNEPARVHFARTEWDRDRGAADRRTALPFSVGLEREADGRTCVSGVGVTASARGR